MRHVYGHLPERIDYPHGWATAVQTTMEKPELAGESNDDEDSDKRCWVVMTLWHNGSRGWSSVGERRVPVVSGLGGCLHSNSELRWDGRDR